MKKYNTQNATANKLVREILSKYKVNFVDPDSDKVASSIAAFNHFWPYIGPIADHHEEFWCLYLNRANKVMGCVQISSGGVAGTVADQKLIFQLALLFRSPASGIICAHNHPSGNLQPSTADIELTRKLKECGKLHDIQIIDHLIIAENKKYFSFAEEGIL